MLRPDPETEFLAFSLPDALTSSLGGLQSLVVRSSMTAARFAGDSVDPKPDRGRGRRGRDRDRHAAARRDRDSRHHATHRRPRAARLLWSHAAQTPVGDLFRVQDELTRRIVASLSLPLTNREQQMLRRDVPSNPTAYEYFLRGNQLSHDAKPVERRARPVPAERRGGSAATRRRGRASAGSIT